MSWNGSGTYNLPALYWPEAPGNLVDSTRYNGTLTDVANGISVALAKDGQNSATANLPMGGNKHTGAAIAVTAGEYLVYGQTGNLANLNLPAAGKVSYSIAGTNAIAGVTVANDGITVGGSFVGMPGTGTALSGYKGLILATDGDERARFRDTGELGIGQTPAAGVKVGVTATGTDIALSISQEDETGNVTAIRTGNSNAADATQFCVYHFGSEVLFGNARNAALRFLVNGGAIASFETTGDFLTRPPSSPPALTVNGTMVMNLTSNTNLRISARGSDGTTRVADITLA